MNQDPSHRDDAVGRLIRLAGEPRTPAAWRVERSRRGVHAAWQASLARRRRQRFLAIGAALAASLLLILGWLAYQAEGPRATAPRSASLATPGLATVARLVGDGATADGVPLAEGDAVRPGALLATSGTGRLALALGKRSLRLDHGSRLRFESEDRVQLLAGALFVDTKPGGPAGFVVVTPWGEVREEGTQFEARLDGDGLLLRVREGSVELTSRRRSERVGAGFELAWTAAGDRRTAPLTAADPAWRWAWEAAPRFPLEGASLASFLAWFERESGQRVELSAALAARAESIRLHGTAPEASPSELLAAVLATCGVEVKPTGGAWFASEAGR